MRMNRSQPREVTQEVERATADPFERGAGFLSSSFDLRLGLDVVDVPAEALAQHEWVELGRMQGLWGRGQPS